MKKFLKIIIILCSILAVVLLAAFLTLKFMFPAEKLKTLAQDYVRKNYQREITFSNVSFNLVGLTLTDFALSERTTFEQGTFLKADQAVLKIALKPLLRKRIEIGTIGLEGLQLNVQKQKDGTFNFDDLLTSTQSTDATPEEPATQLDSAPIVITAQRIYATNCQLAYHDLQQGTSTVISNLNLDIQNFDLDTAFPVQLSFTTDYQDKAGLNVTIPLQAQFTVNLANLDMSKAYTTLDNLSLNYKTVKFTLQGKATNFEKPALELQGKISGLSNTVLADIAPDLPHFVLPDIAFSAQTEIDLTNSTAAITLAKLSVEDSSITTTGTAAWGGENATYNLRNNIQLNLSQLAAMTKLLDGFNMGGTIKGQLTATEKKNGQDVRGTITLNKLAIQYPPVVLSEMNGTITLASLSNITSDKLTGKLNEETFTSSFVYKELANVTDIVFNFDLSKLILTKFSDDSTDTKSEPADETTAPQTGPEKLFNLSTNITIGEIVIPYFTSKGATLTTQLQQASASMKKANGNVQFALQEGAITDLDDFTKDNKIVRIIMLPLGLINKVTAKLGIEIFPAATAQKKGEISFSSGSGSYVFTNGVMTLQETHFDSAISNITATGNINFPTEALDMHVKASVLTAQTPIVIKIGGTMSNPSGKLDVAQTAVSLVGGILNYKTPGKVATSTATTAADVTKTVAATGTDAVKTTVKTTADAVKSIGSLFKKKADTTENPSAQSAVETSEK